jgi:hypothetical protein
VPDALAVALALAAIALDLRGHRRRAVAAGIAAVLAKEATVLVLLGYALARRDRRAACFAAVPASVVALWWLWLRSTLPGAPNQSYEFDPVRGLFRSTHVWLGGTHADAAVYLALAIVVALLALRHGALRSPLGIVLVLQLAFVVLLSDNVLRNSYNSTRAALPLLVTGAIALLIKRPRAVPASAR